MLNINRITPSLTNIGKNCYLMRLERDMSTVDVQRACGVDPSALRKLERGLMRNPSIATLLLLSQAYGCTLDDLIYKVPDEGELAALADIEHAARTDR